MKTLVIILIIAAIAYVGYRLLRARALEEKARRANAINIVDITDVPTHVVDKSIPTAAKPAFDPLAEPADNSSRPAEGLRSERDLLENPVDDSPKNHGANPYGI